MSDPTPISPHELAAAVRAGLDARRVAADPPPAPPGLPFESVTPLAGLRGHPAPPSGGLLGRGVRLARQLVKRLIAPWLDQQTRFNHALLAELQARFQFSPTVELHDFVRRLQDRVNEYALRVERLSGASSGERPPPAPDAVEDVFVQTRLPAPPGTAVVLSDGAVGPTPAVLAAIGFSVLHATAADLAALPLHPASVRVVLALGCEGVWAPDGRTVRAAVAAALTPGGRVFGSRRAGGGPAAEGCAPLRLTDHTHADGVTVWAAEA
jgi:hypothetical protein